jgi:hypothetical protein
MIFFANYIKILLVCLQKVEQLLFIKRRRKEQVLFHLIKATWHERPLATNALSSKTTPIAEFPLILQTNRLNSGSDFC